MGSSNERQSIRLLAAGIVLALLMVLGLSQVLAAGAEGDPTPAPAPQVPSENSRYSGVYSTTAELEAAPFSIERYIAAHSLPAALLAPADLSKSTKTASPNQISPNGTTRFTITVNNSGDTDANVTMTDDLPNGFTYVDHECDALLTDECSQAGGVVTWKGTAIAGQKSVITIDAKLSKNAEAGDVIKNTAQIKSGGKTIEVSANVIVTSNSSSPIQYVPMTVYGIQPQPPTVVLTGGSPNSANEWTMSWTEGVGATGYELQESISPTFEGSSVYAIGTQTQFKITQVPSFDNVFFYRVRSVVGQNRGAWSNTVQVVGGYRDDFDNPNSGWAKRRSTHGDVVKGFYENGKYVMSITSRWDWGIVSPMRPAPRVPYAMQFDVLSVSQTYVHSSGGVFGGDWNQQKPCPNGTSDSTHDACFNHFYNTNTIYNNTNPNDVELQLLFERVDRLDFCGDDNPPCGGAPIKRLGNMSQVRELKSVDPKGWNRFRIEVRADSIKIYAGKVTDPELRLQAEYADTRWVSSPYFGLFSSTDLIEDALYRWDNVQVMPLDN